MSALFNENNNIQITSMNPKLLEQVVKRMKSGNTGSIVQRPFTMDTEYTMLVEDVIEDIESNKMTVIVRIWPDNQNGSYCVKRDIPFFTKGSGVHIWEQFCYDVSNGKAIFSRDIIGTVFLGKISQSKIKDKKSNNVITYEHLIVDKFLDRIDYKKIDIPSTSTAKNTSGVKKTMSLDDEADEEEDIIDEMDDIIDVEDDIKSTDEDAIQDSDNDVLNEAE